MDNFVPKDVTAAMEVDRRNRTRQRSRHRVVAGTREHRVMNLRAHGFVIEADGTPPLRGYVDLYEGGRLLGQLLVVCVWARDGLVGYEFKHDNSGRNVPPDHEASRIAGLIGGPEG